MTEARMIIWLPAPVDEVRQALHKSGVGAGVVVPVESGTVVVPRGLMGLSIAAQWIYRARRRLGRPALLIGWDDEASVVSVLGGPATLAWGWGRVAAGRRLLARLGGLGPLRRALLSLNVALVGSQRGSRRQAKSARTIATALGADEALVLRYVQQDEKRLPPEVLLREVGKPDVADLVVMVERGAFDKWRTGKPVTMGWANALLALALVVATALLFFVPVEALVVYLIGLVLTVVLLVVSQRLRYRYARQPVDEVLPVASDNQSAR
ncbi:hypothetical protein KIPE111705_16740 [Kibdelosporangium persicum]|uniref:Uncharacterized protein n=1 Tax=Kibdelosporangium persicum TaxID=2698649 RepID=A0ABX2EYA8_9PSEU|nr:hypothetical protein [Kibdelosporangium persicum]NRN64026.1 hypothetical protein [Kibdelosporangium persicum]